jgi:glycosyltransferase involved in cell wall biosynthesis
LRVQLTLRSSDVMTGTTRYIAHLTRDLPSHGVEVVQQPPEALPPFVASSLRHVGVDLEAFFSSYPLRTRLQAVDVLHIPSQTMATLLALRKLSLPVVITVLDIIPYLTRDNPELNAFGHWLDEHFYRLALHSLRRANAIIAISEYTKHTLIDTLNLAPDRIFVTHLGVDHQLFCPQPIPAEFYARYGLQEGIRYVLYVGSEDPRKNLNTLIHAFQQAYGFFSQRDIPIALLKVGKAHFEGERQRLIQLTHKLGIAHAVHFLDYVEEEDLPLFYNAAAAFVLPSQYEGFGLPALEAMACGTPTIVADATSLPELGGNLAPTFAPLDSAALAQHLIDVLCNDGKIAPPQTWRAHAQGFDWQKTIQLTRQVYEYAAEHYAR